MATIIPTPFTNFDDNRAAAGSFGRWGPFLMGDALGLGKGDPTKPAPGTIDIWNDVASLSHQPGMGSPLSNAAGSVNDAVGGAMGDLGHWFVRGVVIILGFIFVGVGLAMFKQNIVPISIPKVKP